MGITDIWGQKILWYMEEGGFPVLYRKVRNIFGFYPMNTSSTTPPSVMTTQNVSRHCQLSQQRWWGEGKVQNGDLVPYNFNVHHQEHYLICYNENRKEKNWKLLSPPRLFFFLNAQATNSSFIQQSHSKFLKPCAVSFELTSNGLSNYSKFT